MNPSEIWIRRPVMTILVMAGILIFGVISHDKLPINNLPDVDFPTISVTAKLPGASPEVMASTVATPLEKQFSSIAGIDSMVSTSTLGTTTINLQFSLDRKIDAAAQDVGAAIAAAMGVLPQTMPNSPTYKKVNPADMGIIFISLRSDLLPVSVLNDYAENFLIPHLSQVPGVSDIDIIPHQKYAVRVRVNLGSMAARQIGINDVADAIKNGNVSLPGGTLDGPVGTYTLEPYGQLTHAAAFQDLIVAYQKGAPVRIRDIGEAVDNIENDKISGLSVSGGKRKQVIVLRVRKQPGANTIETVDRIKSKLSVLQANIPAGAEMGILWDQSAFIRESITDVQYTIIFTIFLVVAVIFLFVRAFKATIIPSLVVPISLIAVFPLMSLLGYTLNNLSLMALTLSIGFVIDDAVVVMENIIRRTESGETPLEASIRGSREIGFTVLSMTLSLAVVFIPIMFMGGIMGRLFREFAVCITAAIIISGFLSLTLTPMLCSRLLARPKKNPVEQGGAGRLLGNAFEAALRLYGWSLRKAMRHRLLTLAFTGIVIAATVVLFMVLPKGFIPNQDQNIFRIFTQAHERTSYEAMCRYQDAVVDVLSRDPDCAAGSFVSIAGFSADNNGITFVSLKPPGERRNSVDEIINRLRPKIAEIPGITASLVNPPLIAIGSRFASAQWQFTLQSTEVGDLYRYGASLERKIRDIPYLTDVKSDLQMRKPKLEVDVDRNKASSLGLTLNQIQEAFYSAFGDRQISTIYSSSNFYYVILEVDPSYRRYPSSLNDIYVRSSNNSLVPLGTVSRIKETVAPLAINHSGQLPSATISFNLKPGSSIGNAMEDVNRLARETLPDNISTTFQGSAQAFKTSFASMGFLLVITVVIIYLTLGILYESFIHPITILTSLPLAGFGALSALYLFGMELDLYAYVGIIMLVGIVKKNGIMMVDFALEAERSRGLDSEESIIEACLTRFRPIMMTTMAALFGVFPIAAGLGAGGDARRPLGVAVVGGLLFSQLLTLFITPVFYVYMDRLNRFLTGRKAGRSQSESTSGGIDGVA